MVVEKAVSVAGRGAGSFLGGIFNNPGVVIVAAVGIALFVFKDKIGDFLGGLKFPEFPEIKLPDITFPEFTFPDFPEIILPPPPDFSGLFDFLQGFNPFGPGPPPEPEPEPTAIVQEVTAQCNENCSIVQDATGAVSITCVCDGVEFSGMSEPTIDPPPPPPVEDLPEIIIDPELETEGEFLGGGPSFIGGSIGQTPVTTLFQVLALFPGLSASGAANFLFQFAGISPSEALDLDQFKSFQ